MAFCHTNHHHHCICMNISHTYITHFISHLLDLLTRMKPNKESLKHTWNLDETHIHFSFCIFWAHFNFCLSYFFMKPNQKARKPTCILQKMTWCPNKTLIYLTFHIFWANFIFCHWYFFMKPNQRNLETHPYIAENLNFAPPQGIKRIIEIGRPNNVLLVNRHRLFQDNIVLATLCYTDLSNVPRWYGTERWKAA